MAADLSALHNTLATEPGLLDNISPEDMAIGLAAADTLAGVLTQIIDDEGLNLDGSISVADVVTINSKIRADSAMYALFVAAHGDDENDEETGFHVLQNDGSSLLFQGRNLVDTVIDAIFHIGFEIDGPRFLNEDGDQNQEVADVAGWLNYFLNGDNIVYGTSGADALSSGRYSYSIAGAADEVWYAGGGNDQVGADEGNDTVWAGTGDDAVAGHYGNDLIYGEEGNDALKGDQGNDEVYGGTGLDIIAGGAGRDTLWGGEGNDRLMGVNGNDTLDGGAGDDSLLGGTEADSLLGGAGNDMLSGELGNDTLIGGGDNDALHGGAGADLMLGGVGNDVLVSGEGADTVQGGAGVDMIRLLETVQACDTLVFASGDSGTAMGMIDHVSNFSSGVDKIDLRAFVGMTYEDTTFTSAGPSSYYDGRQLRIDGDGDGLCDMIVTFKAVADLFETDFLFA